MGELLCSYLCQHNVPRPNNYGAADHELKYVIMTITYVILIALDGLLTNVDSAVNLQEKLKKCAPI